MYQKETGSYDTIPEGMKRYINNYVCHFNKKLCEEACKRMYTTINGRKEYITPFSKDIVDTLLSSRNIKLNNNKLYDAMYVANMCKADFYGKSIPDDTHLAMFIKDMIDDPDATEGLIFNRFYSDTVFMNDPIEWEDMI